MSRICNILRWNLGLETLCVWFGIVRFVNASEPRTVGCLVQHVAISAQSGYFIVIYI